MVYPVPDRTSHVSHLDGGLGDRRNTIPDTVMLGIGISFEMTS
jgi:hypothetical protein